MPSPTGFGADLFGAAWLLFLRHGSSRSFVSSCRVCSLNRLPSSRLGTRPIMRSVSTKNIRQKYRIWVDRTSDRLFVIYARCTHLGCTPDWKPAENKFKCPCHGRGYDSEGINFEGPRPMDCAHLELAPDGQIVVDAGHFYSWPKGQRDQFNDQGAYLSA
jgi:nitrite reductase/ring-hydroxylating ferredoxin subunit